MSLTNLGLEDQHGGQFCNQVGEQMKANTSRWFGWMVLLSAGACHSALGACSVPGKPAPLVVELGLPGTPPALRQPQVADQPAGATHCLFEFRRVTASGSKLFAQTWAPPPLFNWAGFYLHFVNGGGGPYYQMYLRGTGAGGLRAFPAGTYRLRWLGKNACGKGPWSDETQFEVAPVAVLPVVVTQGPPPVVGPTGDVAFAWTNAYAASAYKVEMRRGAKIVRNKTLPGGYSTGYDRLIDERLAGNSYADRPKSRIQELPNGTGYVFRVKAYSPNAKKWSPWTTNGPFRIARGAPTLPNLSVSQMDYEGAFTRSMRPYFAADYGDLPALWTGFEIWHVDANNAKTLVRRQWVSRYGESGTAFLKVHSLGGSDPWVSTLWRKDLPSGKYEWRVQAWNGAGPGESVAKGVTSIVVSAGALAKPLAPYKLEAGGSVNWIYWIPVPNAYSYEAEIYKNGKLYRKSPVLDAAKQTLGTYLTLSKDEACWRSAGKLPAGIYTLRVRALNKANPVGQRDSEWSNFSAGFAVP